ncbi:MAG: hypothetical protein V9G22_12710 [Ottowia sp.]
MANSLPFFDAVLAPVVGEFVARFLPAHALLDPLVAAALLLPGLAGTVQRLGGVGNLLHTLVAHLGQPQLDGLGLGAGHGLHQAQQGLGGGAVGQIAFCRRRRAISVGDSLSPTDCLLLQGGV